MEEMEQQQTPEWISILHNWYEFGKSPICNSQTVNNIIPPSQTQPGLLATAVPHSIPAKPRKVCTLSPSLMTVNVVVCVCILYLHFCDVMMSLQVM